MIDEAKQQQIQAFEPDEKTDRCFVIDTDTHYTDINAMIKYFPE